MSPSADSGDVAQSVAKRVGEWLSAARRKAGLTQVMAATLSGVDYGVVTRSETGRDLMTSSFLRLAWLYGADAGVGELLEAISTEQHETTRVAEPRVAYEIRERALKSTDPVPASRGSAAVDADAIEKPRRRRRKSA